MVWFTEVDLRMAAGPTSFERGRKLRDTVREVELTAEGVRAVVPGSEAYAVFLGPASPGLIGECGCPYSRAGNFCKHCVALGLAVLAADPPPGDRRAYLRSLASGSAAPQVAVLQRQLDASLWVRGPVDHDGSLEYARLAGELLDTVDELIVAGHSAEARPLSRRAVERITESLLLIDDTAGTVVAACQRALSLYARACTIARPNSGKLAAWLFQLQRNSPGWPTVTLAEFVDALGEAGLATYRTLVSDAWENRADDIDIRGSLTLLLMRDRLAKLDGEPPPLALPDGLPDPAVFLGVSGGDRAEWLTEFLVQAYVNTAREQDALELRRSGLRARPTREHYARLRQTAELLGCWDQVRPWALEVLRSAAESGSDSAGAALVGALLDDGEPAEAWGAAEDYGCPPELWLQVARVRAASHPADVLAGYRALIESCVERTGRRHYREAIGLLRELRAASDPGYFAEVLAGLRTRHRRKPALLDELDRAGL